jgi:hypothetical protein
MKTYSVVKNEYNPKSYTYQPYLTEKLKNTSANNLDQEWVNEIVLWKLNRYVRMQDDILALLNDPRLLLNEMDVSFTRTLLHALLDTPGVRLPMASTFLRFRNPRIYQILDQRAYRFATGKTYFSTYSDSDKGRDKQIDLYLEYLSKLKEICLEKKWDFEKIDEILYQLDKIHNADVSIKV